jgi:hypothetical protein
VARCQSHTSWVYFILIKVTGVAFDLSKCSDGVYRFISVGEDTRICFWDFSIAGLHRKKYFTNSMPRAMSRMEIRQKDQVTYHEAPLKSQVPIIEALIVDFRLT